MCTFLMNKDNVNERLLKEIFTYLFHISKLLCLNDKDIMVACYKKIIKNEDMNLFYTNKTHQLDGQYLLMATKNGLIKKKVTFLIGI